MTKKNKKNIFIVSLVIMLFIMGSGYALMIQNLNISSDSVVEGNWNIYVSDITLMGTTGTAVSKKASISLDKKGCSFIVDFYDKNDSASYTITVKNDGNIAAKLDSIDQSSFNTSKFVGMATDVNINDGVVLQPGKELSFSVKLYVKNPDNETLTDQENIKYEIDLNFVQDDGTVSGKTPSNDELSSVVNYSGYYADIDGDCNADGIIFVDLMDENYADGTNWTYIYNKNWKTSSNFKYKYNTISSSKTYKICNKKYNDSHFGENYVISIKNSSGNDRFYVMGLNDIDSKISDSSSDTVGVYIWNHFCNIVRFEGNIETTLGYMLGKGKTYTSNAISFNDGVLTTDYLNIWHGIRYDISSGTEVDRYSQGWFIPSPAEWSAFRHFLYYKYNYFNNSASQSNGSTDTYSTYGLSNSYWTSAQYDRENAWMFKFSNTDFETVTVGPTASADLRLAITF